MNILTFCSFFFFKKKHGHKLKNVQKKLAILLGRRQLKKHVQSPKSNKRKTAQPIMFPIKQLQIGPKNVLKQVSLRKHWIVDSKTLKRLQLYPSSSSFSSSSSSILRYSSPLTFSVMASYAKPENALKRAEGEYY